MNSKVLDVLFYLNLLILLIWSYLKVAGYINTPIILQIMPYAAAIFGAGVFYQKVNNLEKRMDALEIEVKENSRGIGKLENKFTKLEAKILIIDKDIGFLRNDFEVMKKAIA